MTIQEVLKSGLPYKLLGERHWRPGEGGPENFTRDEVLSDQWVVQPYEAREECKQLMERIQQLRQRYYELGGL